MLRFLNALQSFLLSVVVFQVFTIGGSLHSTERFSHLCNGILVVLYDLIEVLWTATSFLFSALVFRVNVV